MGQAADCCEAAANYVSCHIKHEAAEDFDELARLVGEGTTLETSHVGDDVDEAAPPSWTEVTEADAPRLEFDLEDELSRAFDGAQTPEPASDLGPDFGSRALHEAVSASDPAPIAVEPELEAEYAQDPVLAPDPAPASIPVSQTETLSFDQSEHVEEGAFSGLVSNEIEKALHEFEEEVDVLPAVEATGNGVAETEALPEEESVISEDSLEDFSMELARLMGEPDALDATAEAPAAEVTTPPVAPAPAEAVMPWEAPEIVQQSAPALEDAPPAPETPTYQTAAFQPSHTPSAHFPQAAPLEVPELESSAEVDDVLARADAVETAAAQDAALDDGFDYDLEAALSRELDAEMETSNEEAESGPTVIPPIYMPGADRVEKSFTGRRIAAGIAALALLGGSAALAWNFASSDTSEPPTILASQDPVKVKPKETGGKVVPNQDQSVYTAVDGNDKDKPQQDALKDNSEKPIAVAKAPSAGAKPAETASTSSAEGGLRAGTTDPQTTGGPIIAPRRVRTVVVRPDGTILTQPSTAKSESTTQDEVALATSSEAPKPVAVKTTTEAPSTETPTSEAQTEIAAVPQEAPNEPEIELKPVKIEPTAEPAQVPPAKPTPATKPAAVAKQPAPKPVKVTKVEPPKPAVKKPVEPAAADPLAPTTVSSPYKVQVSSQRSAEAAQQSYNSLARRFASIIGGKGVDYQKTKVKGRDYVRVRIPAQSKAEAQRMCGQLKANGGDCFVTR